jgi:chromosome partitioning protein
MILTVASFKGGVGKTTSAIHFAAYLQQQAPTLLIDGDPNRSATTWARLEKLPFKVVDERAAPRHIRAYEHIVIDTKARLDGDDLKGLVEGCDMLVIPSKPDLLSLDALRLTANTLKSIGATRYRVLLTVTPPRPSNDAEQARLGLTQDGYPVLRSIIRRFKAYEDAAREGVPIYALTGNPRAQEGWRDYEEAAKEMEI